MRWLMPVEEILRLPSGDSRDEYFNYAYGTVAEVLEGKSHLSDYHKRIRNVMGREGVNLVPVCVQNDMFLDGHHRVMIACELGHEEMLVTDRLDESGWYDDRKNTIVVGEENC